MATAGSACVARRESRRRQAQTSAVGRVHTREVADADEADDDDDDAGEDDDDDDEDEDDAGVDDDAGEAPPTDTDTGARKRDESTLIDLRRKRFDSSAALSSSS
jgi:hypothetical protein